MASITVVELAQGVAGPACGRLFAALGHEVIKCEPAGGDYLRKQPPLSASGLGLAFAELNAGKRSVVADLGTPAGRARLGALLDSADVLITDLVAAQLSAAGLDRAALRRRWPRLAVVSITGSGSADDVLAPQADSLLAEAYGGLATMIGEPGARPLSLGGEQTAYAAGFVGLFAAMLALGDGGFADIAMSDVAAYVDWKSDVSYAVTGLVPQRAGTQHGRWRTVPARDGDVGIIFEPHQWEALGDLVADTRLRDPRLASEAGREALAAQWWPLVATWASGQPKRAIYAAAQRHGLAIGYSSDMADIARSPQYLARGFVSRPDGAPGPVTGPLFQSNALPWHSGTVPALGEFTAPGASRAGQRAPRRRPPGAPPLAGVRVLDFGTITAGAAVTRLLADYGATVIKVESAGHPDPFRTWTPTGLPADQRGGFRHEEAMFDSNNAGKLGVSLDLTDPRDRARVHELARDAHVVVENFRVGVTRKLGIDYPTLRALNPRLVYLSLSSQGQTGPEASYRSYGSTLDLLSGLASVTGYEAGQPVWSSADVNYPDQLVSLLGAGLVAYCLRQGAEGAYLDVAQREVVTWTLGGMLGEYLEHARVPGPTGNRRPGRTPHDVYPCAGPGQWVAIEGRAPAERGALASVVGLDADLAADTAWWWSHQDEADALITAWTQARPRDACLAELRRAGVPCAPVLAADERAADEHFLGRRVFLAGPPRLKGFPMVLDFYDPPRPGPAPRLGEHDAEVREHGWGR